MTRLTKRRLDAIEEALNARIMGGIDDDNLDVADYKAARQGRRSSSANVRR